MKRFRLAKGVTRKQIRAKIDEIKRENGSMSVEGIATLLIVAGLLVPIGMQFINDADTGSWTAQQLLAWGAIGTIAIVAVVLGFLKTGGFSKGD